MLADKPTIAERVIETGTRGEGGDNTLEIDQMAEDVVFAELQKLHDAGARFTAVSEEARDRGLRRPGPARRDRPDRRLDQRQARACRTLRCRSRSPRGQRWLTSCSDSCRISDLTRSGWRLAARARSSTASPLDCSIGERRTADGKLEVLGIESADPRWVVQSADALADTAHRLRAIGAIAVSLCQVAAGRFDAMASLKRCRAVDAAAAQLIVREAGGLVEFIAYDDPLAAPLDLEPHSPVIAARTPEGLASVRRVPAWP